MSDTYNTDTTTSPDFFNYYMFKDSFSIDELEKIIELGESSDLYEAPLTGIFSVQNLEVRNSKISWIEYSEDTEWIYEKLFNYCKIANETMGWDFDIDGIYEPLQYTIYDDESGNHFWYPDLDEKTPNRKISMVLELSTPEEYNDGDLQFNLGGLILNVDKQIGNLTIFPSYILHRVLPITLGVKRQLVLWISGKPFK